MDDDAVVEGGAGQWLGEAKPCSEGAGGSWRRASKGVRGGKKRDLGKQREKGGWLWLFEKRLPHSLRRA